MRKIVEAEERPDEAVARELSYLENPDEHLTPRQLRWLAPPGRTGRTVRRVLYGVNSLAVRLLFRLRVIGIENLPESGPLILAPNHGSSLDPFVLSAAMGFARFRNTCWAGRQGALVRNRGRRWINRLAHAIPIRRNASALAVGAAALQRGRILVWFPEGHRSETGELQPFKRGAGVLMDHFQVPAVPAFIDGAFEAMPRNRRLPRRLPRITVAFGRRLDPAEYSREEDRERRIERIVDVLRQQVAALRNECINH
jgi:long-chain acyl-CoA synthetase